MLVVVCKACWALPAVAGRTLSCAGWRGNFPAPQSYFGLLGETLSAHLLSAISFRVGQVRWHFGVSHRAAN